MPIPTSESRPPLAGDLIREIDQMFQQIRADAEQWLLDLAAGDVEIEEIKQNLYIPYAASAARGGYLKTLQEARAAPLFDRTYQSSLGLFFEFGPSEVNLANNRFQIGENNFAIDDGVRFLERDALPNTAPQIAEGTTYYVLAKPNATTVTLSTTIGGAEIDITGRGSGQNAIRAALVGEFNDLETALDGVIDEIIAVIPTEATTAELLSEVFDKALAFGDTGLRRRVVTSTQTATLRTRLQAVVDAIEAAT